MTSLSGREHRAPGIREVRERALFDLDDGPVTPSNRAELTAIARLLNVLLASMIVSSLNHEHHALLARAPAQRPLADFLYSCADHDWIAARRIALRIRQLGFDTDHDPHHLAARSRLAFRAFHGHELDGIVTHSLLGARIIVQTLQEAVRWIGDDDPTTRRILEALLEEKEGQADALNSQRAPTELQKGHT